MYRQDQTFPVLTKRKMYKERYKVEYNTIELRTRNRNRNPPAVLVEQEYNPSRNSRKKELNKNRYKSGIDHQLLSFIKKSRNPREIRNHLTAMADQQELLGIGRETQVGRGFTLRQIVNPDDELAHASGLRQRQKIVVLYTRDELVAIFEGGGCKEAIDQVLELLVIACVVDFTTVHLCDKSADHLPGNLLRSHVGTALGH